LEITNKPSSLLLVPMEKEITASMKELLDQLSTQKDQDLKKP